MTASPKGRVTFRIAAVFSAASAVWELVTFQATVLLFGALTGGALAVTYHVVYALLFGWLAVGLWRGTRDGFYVLIAAAVVNTVDRLQVVSARDMLETLIRAELAGREELLQAIGMDFLMQSIILMIFVVIACWWGFVAYAWYRRPYFGFIKPAA